MKTRTTVVAGGFVLIAALIGLIIPFISHFLRHAPELLITHVTSSAINSQIAIDILLRNNADVPESVTGLELTLWQTGPPLKMIGRTIYELRAKFHDDTGQIEGQVTDFSEASSDLMITHPVTGKLVVHDRGDWSVRFTLPLREELKANGHRSVLVVFPESMEVTGTSIGILNRLLGKTHTLSQSNKALDLTKFLKARGQLGIKLKVTYGEGDTDTYKGTITFAQATIE